MKNTKYILCADAESGRWQQPVSKDVTVKAEAVKELADLFYVKGEDIPASTIVAEFDYLDTLLAMFSKDTLFLIPICHDEIIIRLDEAFAKEEIKSFNKNEEEPRFTLYKYEKGTLSRITTK